MIITPPVLQTTIGVVFAVAVIPKLLKPREFSNGVADYQLLSEPLSKAVALGVILPAEATIAFGHLTGWLLFPSQVIAIALLAVFMIAVAIAVTRGLNIDCQCFGETGEPLGYGTLLRILMLLTIESYLLYLATSQSVGPQAPSVFGTRLLAGVRTQLPGVVALLVIGRWIFGAPYLATGLRLRDVLSRHLLTNRG